MGTFLNEIQQQASLQRPNRFNQILSQLNEEDAKDLIEAIANPSIFPTAIQKALRNRNIFVDRGTIKRWKDTM
jgi:hypothetical protein